MSQLEVDKVIPQSGTTLTLGESGDTVSVPSGATLDASNATLTLPDGTVTNAKVNASAAIAYSKLNLATSIVNADISTTAAIATTKLGAGAVLQVVSATDSSSLSSTSATFVDTGLTASITPSSASNKVLVLVTMGVFGADAASSAGATIKLVRGATDLISHGSLGAHPTITYIYTAGTSFAYLDSPSTTSSTTYKTQFRSDSGTLFTVDNASTASIVLMEISG